MTGYISFCLLLFLTGRCDCTLRETISPVFHGNAARYCDICDNHTMCQFPLDKAGANCVNLEDGSLDEKDIETIVERHNFYRNVVASGKEERGDPGPQRPAKYMMELIWDDELARIARRWALQCNLFEKDQCRDVERFEVWQNVHVLDMDSVGNRTSAARIYFHIQSWYDEVEHFDSAEFGFVNFSARSDLSYVAFASALITQIGCGRAIYIGKPRTGRQVEDRPPATDTMPNLKFVNRVETLVCNYGPLDRRAPGKLYEDGAPGLCPPGTIRRQQYSALCRKFQERSSQQKVQRRAKPRQEQREEVEEQTNGGTSLVACTIYLGQLLLLLRLSI